MRRSRSGRSSACSGCERWRSVTNPPRNGEGHHRAAWWRGPTGPPSTNQASQARTSSAARTMSCRKFCCGAAAEASRAAEFRRQFRPTMSDRFRLPGTPADSSKSRVKDIAFSVTSRGETRLAMPLLSREGMFSRDPACRRADVLDDMDAVLRTYRSGIARGGAPPPCRCTSRSLPRSGEELL